ncbi:MAG: hypothetical protein PWQ41_864 [Bacillota bacterium]|nr:hypothetical protein [Bacillota bacterium]MDK2856325.1 hypothetical protein [Bacillota bacterium]MDK2925090.1 hypothetical protein [Bacillota bacterium]
MKICPISNMAELDQVTAIFQSLRQYFYDYDIIRVREDISHWLQNRNPGVEYFAGFHNDMVVACLGYRKDYQAHEVYYLSHFAVHAAFRGRGLGSQMLRFVEERLRQLGARLIVVWTSTLDYTRDTRAFYEAKGYIHCADIPDYWRDGDPLALYIKKL